MEVIVLQHISIEDPGFIKDLIRNEKRPEVFKNED